MAIAANRGLYLPVEIWTLKMEASVFLLVTQLPGDMKLWYLFPLWQLHLLKQFYIPQNHTYCLSFSKSTLVCQTKPKINYDSQQRCPQNGNLKSRPLPVTWETRVLISKRVYMKRCHLPTKKGLQIIYKRFFLCFLKSSKATFLNLDFTSFIHVKYLDGVR